MAQNNKTNNQNFFEIKKREQYRTVDELMQRSAPTPVYYTLLILSSFIIAAGLLLNNAAVVIGGMLVTPVLTPVLLIGLGLAVGEVKYTKQVAVFVGKSFAVIVIASFILAFLFDVDDKPGIFLLEDTLRGAILYFVVALSSGFAATFAWVRRELTEVLPGIAIAVSLVPPLSLIGIGLSTFDLDMMRINFLVFIFNCLGVIVGSILVFSLLKFHKVEKKIEQEIRAQEKEKEKKAKEKEKEKKKEKAANGQ